MEHKIKILIVEDESLIAENLKLTLEDLGYEVVDTCYTFAEAAAAVSTTDADLVLLDINLGSKAPGENGLAAGSMFKASTTIPFIFLTAYSDAETIRQAAQLQPAGYLVKPVNPQAVFAAIQLAIEAAARNVPPQPPVADEPPPEQPDFFFVKVGPRTHKVRWEDVYCIEAGKNYVKLRLTTGGGEYAIRGTIAFVTEQLLPPSYRSQFVRVSRSVSLNRQHITSFGTDAVYCGSERFESTRLSVRELEELTQL